MGLSIITPHFNDFSGIKRLYDCFQIQTSELWQWIIVDDCSDMDVKNEVESFFFEKKNNHIHIIFSKAKTNASHCRNLGASQAQYDNVVFLDSDDYIFPDFVANRLIEVKEFCVFLNIEIKNYRGDIQPFSNIESDFLDNFLKARFAWQTTAVLWNKAYFDKIKGFDDKLSNLQDIEISIKALFQGKNYRIITNNEVDFQYFVTPINTEKRTIFKITQSVIYLLKKLVADYNLSNRQLKYLRGYYFLCVRYYVRGKLIKEGEPVMQNCLKVFRQIKILGQVEFLWASFLLKMYRHRCITTSLFVKANRYFFKT